MRTKSTCSKVFPLAKQLSTRFGFPGRRTTSARRGSCACWRKLRTRFLRLLKRMKRRKNVRTSNRRWRRACASTPPRNKLPLAHLHGNFQFFLTTHDLHFYRAVRQRARHTTQKLVRRTNRHAVELNNHVAFFDPCDVCRPA